MKVVLFCGGQGMRMKEYSEAIPKPMVPIGPRPILWHMMKYYAHYGHNEFVLCLGHQGHVIKDYFLRYDECVSNDFTLSCGSKQVELANRDLENWTIRFVDTGLNATIGQRLRAVRPFFQDDDIFLANYSDAVTDLRLPELLRFFKEHDAVGVFVSIQPGQSFHVVSANDSNLVESIKPVGDMDIWINGGYFVFRHSIFDYIREGEELVVEPFQRLIAEKKLITYKYRGFWTCMDTFKDRQRLEDLYTRGEAAWQVWQFPPIAANAADEPVEQRRRACRTDAEGRPCYV
jgi:glucose-1-phosphate cytidylyltransferase